MKEEAGWVNQDEDHPIFTRQRSAVADHDERKILGTLPETSL
jgi:hypothetical protein